MTTIKKVIYCLFAAAALAACSLPLLALAERGFILGKTYSSLSVSCTEFDEAVAYVRKAAREGAEAANEFFRESETCVIAQTKFRLDKTRASLWNGKSTVTVVEGVLIGYFEQAGPFILYHPFEKADTVYFIVGSPVFAPDEAPEERRARNEQRS